MPPILLLNYLYQKLSNILMHTVIGDNVSFSPIIYTTQCYLHSNFNHVPIFKLCTG